MTKYGFCADYHYKTYVCTNTSCNHEEQRTKITNFYSHELPEWEDVIVCPVCGFKTLKPGISKELKKALRLE